MSWLENLNTDLTITTGDGKVYTPGYLRSNRSVEYNTTLFKYIDVAGTYVDRREPEGGRATLELYFQGENYLDEVKAFLESAADKRPWTLEHPLYDTLLVQPVGIAIDDEMLNVSKLTIPVIETIKDIFPATSISAADQVATVKITADEQLAEAYAVDVPAPKVADRQDMRRNISTGYNNVVKRVKDTLDADSYFNAFNTANSYINQVTQGPKDIMRQIQNLINAPALFKDSVQNRIDALMRQFDALRETLKNTITLPQKRLYENNAGTTITAICLAATSGILPTDYNNRNQIAAVLDTILQAYNTYMEDISLLQAVNGAVSGGYIPTGTAMVTVSHVISLTVSSLFAIATNSRQERTVVLTEDSNWVSLAKKLVGLKADDSTILELMDMNVKGPDDVLLVYKGRKVSYYI